MAVSRVAFYRAVADGDLAIVQAYWAQPPVRADVRETDEYIASTRQRSPSFRRDGALAWFFTQEHWDPRAYRFNTHYPQFLPRLASDNGHAHIVEWLFAQHDSIGATLLLLLPRAMAGARLNGPSSVEVLLTSQLFQHELTAQSRQALLDEWLRFPESIDVVHVLVAHGARVNAGTGLSPLAHAEMAGSTPIVECLVSLGAHCVGVKGVHR